MSYSVQIKQVPPEVIATERRHTALTQLGDAMHATLDDVAAAVQPPNATRGDAFGIYYNEPCKVDDIDVEMGVPIAGTATVDPSSRVQRRQLSGGPVAFTVHAGPYEGIGAAYMALYGWLKLHGLEPLGPPREIYLVGPGEVTDPVAYRTEIDVPIK